MRLPSILITTAIFLTIFCPCVATAQKMVKKQRIKTIWNLSYQGNNVEMADSMLFYYSGTRGSNFNSLSYSPLAIFERDYGYNIHFTPESIVLPDISPAFHERGDMAVAFDSVYEYTRYTNNRVLLAERSYASYNANNELMLFQQKEIYNDRHTITRDVSGLPTSVRYDQFDSSRNWWQDKMRLNILQGKNMLPATDTTYYEWPARPNYIDLASAYSYDNSGHIIGEKRFRRYWNDWRTYEEYRYSYDDQGRVTKRIYIDDGNIDEVRHVFYDATSKITRVLYTPIDDTGYKHYEIILNYNAGGDVVGMTQRDYSGSTVNARYEIALYYNSHHNPDSVVTHSYNGNGVLLPRHYRTYYNYDVYDAPDTASSSYGIIIYANPARSIFNIKWNNQRPVQPVYVNIYSSNGQRVLQKYISKAGATETIGIGGLESGLYHLRIVTESGAELYTGKLAVQQ